MEGTVLLRVSGSRPYVYVRHGRVWHYIGTLDRVNLESIITSKAHPGITIKYHNVMCSKAVIIAVLTIMTIVITTGIIMGYLTLNNVNINADSINNTINTILISHSNFNISDEFIITNHSEINICPLINDID
ncbi:hypothetical protein GCM10007112_03340 [Vulcanisaeta souniana JCM 11219]|nr:hypothetical protein GCM10007112_03340 [Vulcanisaeta souniana JCM 11219]